MFMVFCIPELFLNVCSGFWVSFLLLSNVHFRDCYNHYDIYYGVLPGDLYLCKNSKADLNGKKFMFNTV